jgi:hypothetical protein
LIVARTPGFARRGNFGSQLAGGAAGIPERETCGCVIGL